MLCYKNNIFQKKTNFYLIVITRINHAKKQFSNKNF